MEDQFDEDLRSHIRKVFDDYHDTSADEGWSLLRKKFPEKEKRRPIIWVWWSAAALLLLFIGIGIWRYEGSYKAGITRVTPVKPSKHEDMMAAAGHAETNPKIQETIKTPDIDSGNKDLPKDLITAVKRKQLGNPILLSPKTSASAAVTGRNENTKLYAAKNNDGTQPIAVQPITPGGTQVASINSTTQPGKSLAGKSDTAPVAAQQPLTTVGAQVASVNPNTQPVKSQAGKADKPKPSIYSMFAAAPPKEEKSPEKKPLIRLGVYAATYVSYAAGSSNQGNFGAGFTADLRITKNLKLVSGVGVLQNSLSFNSSIPSTVSQNIVLPTYSYAGYVAPASHSVFNLMVAANVASLPDFKNYDASMYGLDIPVNLRYDFNPQKNNLYIMAGLSSGTYINESYTYKYNYPDLSSPSLQQTQAQTSSRSFNSYYFGKVVNFALGFGYPLGKNTLILEPFVKYPLDGLGSQNIRFGSGGVNLKFNFPSSSK